MFVFQESGERVAPDPRRDLETFGDSGLEETGRDGPGQCAFLKLPGDTPVNGVFQPRNDGLPELRDDRVGPVADERAHRDETAGAPG